MAPPSRRYRRLLANLRTARHQAGLTQVEVARRLDRTQQWISRIENGQRRLDPIELDELASLYGVALQDLIPPA